MSTNGDMPFNGPLLCDLCRRGGDAQAHLRSVSDSVMRELSTHPEDIGVMKERHADVQRLGRVLHIDPSTGGVARSMVLFGHVLHRVLTDRLEAPSHVVDALVAYSTVPVAWPRLWGAA